MKLPLLPMRNTQTHSHAQPACPGTDLVLAGRPAKSTGPSTGRQACQKHRPQRWQAGFNTTCPAYAGLTLQHFNTFTRMKLFLFFFSFTPFLLHAQLSGLSIKGDPAGTGGATWTYSATVDGIPYELEGILFKPPGNGPFPAVIINHGTGMTVYEYGKHMAEIMVTWGYVCIGTNYTHAGSGSCGAPGKCELAEFGASESNVYRARKCWDILASLAYVDTSCIKAFGHSRGAFITMALVATYPDKFSAAGHTGGGVSLASGDSAPSAQLVSKVRCPYAIHHGSNDFVVKLQADSLFNETLNSSGTIHSFYVYEGVGHDDLLDNPLMLERTREWFEQYNCGIISDTPDETHRALKVFPVPAKGQLTIEFPGIVNNLKVTCYTIHGQETPLKLEHHADHAVVTFDSKTGLYLLYITINNKTIIKKILLSP